MNGKDTASGLVVVGEMVSRATTAALVSLAKAGIPTDVQGLLVGGDERGTVAPGALQGAIIAALVEAVSPELAQENQP
jgi:hypothetical protein